MKKISLQWRLTLMTAIFVMAACLLLNIFISHSAVMRIDEMENYIVEIAPSGEESITIGLDGSEFFPGFKEQVQKSKHLFYVQSILATLSIMLSSSILTYFLAGRALSPLRQFSSHIEKIQAQNLSEPLAVPCTEDEITRLTLSFNEMQERLNQTFMEQRRFSANAAHELRTPLAVLQTNLDVLKKQKNPTLEEYNETIQMISKQTRRLSHLVNVLLEMTELQTIKRNDQISLASLTEEVICDLMQIADENNVTLIQEPGDAMVTGSDLLLYRAIYNLVENAIKYNRTNGTVTISIETKDNTAILRIKDTGTGIPEENWENIFEPFICIDKSRSRTMGGAGLGLALVRNITEQHNGNVRVANSSNQGTEIWLTLPFF